MKTAEAEALPVDLERDLDRVELRHAELEHLIALCMGKMYEPAETRNDLERKLKFVGVEYRVRLPTRCPQLSGIVASKVPMVRWAKYSVGRAAALSSAFRFRKRRARRSGSTRATRRLAKERTVTLSPRSRRGGWGPDVARVGRGYGSSPKPGTSRCLARGRNPNQTRAVFLGRPRSWLWSATQGLGAAVVRSRRRDDLRPPPSAALPRPFLRSGRARSSPRLPMWRRSGSHPASRLLRYRRSTLACIRWFVPILR